MPHNPDKPYELRYLSRIVIPPKPKKAGTYGWQFRFHREDINITRFFSDSKFGGKEQALTRAQEFRDEIEKLYPSPLTNKERYTRRTSKNKSGIVGVSRTDYTYTKKDRKGTYFASAWVAQWTDKSGKRKTKSFAIQKYGEREALKLAITARRMAIDEITETESPQIQWGENDLNKLVALIEKSTNSNEKGKALEELLVRIFENSQAFFINGINTITETEEIDIMILNNSNDARFKRESAILLVECKNWSNKCGKNEFVIFKEKVENRKSRCSIGFFISWNGFADTVTKEMLRGSREQALVIPLDGNDIKKAVRTNDIEKILADAWDKAITL